MNPMLDENYYERTCPFCGKTTGGHAPLNLVCGCNAKYYYF